MASSLILTATMDEKAQKFFNSQRKKFFPKEINFLDAHITVFHKLPGEHVHDIHAVLSALAVRQALSAEASGVRFLGRGSAYDVSCAALTGIRAELAGRWQSWLRPQDRQAFRPHITIQNKAEPHAARVLYESLSSGFERITFGITGFGLWNYLNGPWSLAGCYRFE